jgi:hypothetical protein
MNQTQFNQAFLKTSCPNTNINQIAFKNDVFRRSGFGVHLTTGVQALVNILGLIQAVQNFNDFNEDNDPYGEHDFGKLDWKGETILWKIDYYDQALEFGEDPLSPKCRRVLTVMLADEY